MEHKILDNEEISNLFRALRVTMAPRKTPRK